MTTNLLAQTKDKLVVVGSLAEGYYIYYLIFSADMKECKPYKYSLVRYETEYAADDARFKAEKGIR